MFLFYRLYYVDLANGFYLVNSNRRQRDWYHLTLMYHGEGNGVSVYHDGDEVGVATYLYPQSPRASSSGHMVVGTDLTDGSGRYSSVIVDELTFWDN